MKNLSLAVLLLSALFSAPSFGQSSDLITVLDSPCRLYDSRNVGSFSSGSKINSATIETTDLALDTIVYTHAATPYNYQGGEAGCRIPPGSLGIVANLFAISPDGGGYVRLWATGQPEPKTTSVTFASGQADESSGIVVRVGIDGQISVNLPFSAAHLAIDITGYIAEGTTTGLSGDVESVTVIDPDFTQVVLTSGSEIWCQSSFVDTSICEDYEVGDHVVAIGHPLINTGELVVVAHLTEKKP